MNQYKVQVKNILEFHCSSVFASKSWNQLVAIHQIIQKDALCVQQFYCDDVFNWIKIFVPLIIIYTWNHY